MPSYFYIAILIAWYIYPLVRSIYLFRKGKYIPYFEKGKYGTNKGMVLWFGWIILYDWSLSKVNLSHFSFLIINLVFILFYILCISILGYLSYRKVRTHKIIYSTVILDIVFIAVSLFALYLYLHHQ